MLRPLLFSALITLATIPGQALAQSSTCEQLQSLNPISSQYTQRVLDRSKAGFEYAKSGTIDNDFSLYLTSWTRSVSEAVSETLDASLRLNIQENSLNEQTACLRLDSLLIECEMEKVEAEMLAQLKRGSFRSIQRLLDLYRFLNERLRHLQLGALDPAYIDPTWGFERLFDPPKNSWCCVPGSDSACKLLSADECTTAGGTGFETVGQCTNAGCEAPSNVSEPVNMCPYNADFAPATLNGFGCDLEVMESRTAYAPLKAEYDALKIVMDDIDEYRQEAARYASSQEDINSVYGVIQNTQSVGSQLQHMVTVSCFGSFPGGNVTMTFEEFERSRIPGDTCVIHAEFYVAKEESTEYTPLAPAPTEYKHLQAFGCAWTGGYCTGDHAQQCITDDTCQKKNLGTCEEPTKVCENNRIKTCFVNADCGQNDRCIPNDDGQPSERNLRGNFSIDKDHLGILEEFIGARATQELSRKFSSELTFPSEAETDAERTKLESQQDNFLHRLVVGGERMVRRAWSREHGRQESEIFPQAVDAQLEIAHELQPMREAVSRLAKLASDKDKLRGFVTRLAYFLRRTCIDRSCNLVLEQVMRLSNTDECFPYSDGEFLEDTANNPRWQKCKDAAEIRY